jgi:hypothetical protein
MAGVAANRDRVVEALRLSSQPLDDDQLSDRADIRPRQQVNQICRALERAGLVRRYQGPDGKIVNELAQSGRVGAAVDSGATTDSDTQIDLVVDRATDRSRPPGSSQEQRNAERVMLDLLGAELGVALAPARITVPSGARVEVDGADADRTVIVECWAHQGTPKAAQRHKVLADAFKLTWISSTIYPRPRLFLCLSDPVAAAPFLPQARSWAAQALQDLGMTVAVVPLPEEVRLQVQAAQQRQYR